MSTYRMSLYRESERRTSDEKLIDQLEFIALRALSGNRGRGWAYEVGTITAVRELDMWVFDSWIEFRRRVPGQISEEKERAQWEDIREGGHLAGQAARFGSKPWNPKREKRVVEKVVEKVSQVPTQRLVYDSFTGGLDMKEEAVEKPEMEIRNEPVDPPEDDSEPIPLSSISRIVPGDTYSHLYGLDAQIRILLSAIQAAADSEMRNRFHSLLWGDPGAGKTDILLSTHKLLTDLGISCLSIDATSTTQAGLMKLLLDEDETVPEVILIEEIEKASHSFKLLLGIMDERGTVSQMNFRKTAIRRVPALVLASANDYGLLQKFDSGAMLSRFSNEIYCPRPDRGILARILQREIEKLKNGKMEWIEPTLEYAFDRKGITDPRFHKRVCLCGKDLLLTGQYQEDLEKTMKGQGQSQGQSLEQRKNTGTNLDIFD